MDDGARPGCWYNHGKFEVEENQKVKRLKIGEAEGWPRDPVRQLVSPDGENPKIKHLEAKSWQRVRPAEENNN